MSASLSSPARGPRLRLPARTARLRLTLLYAALFLGLGTAVIFITFALTSSGSAIRVSRAVPAQIPRTLLSPTAPGTTAVVPSPTGGEVIRQHSADLSRQLEVSWLVLAVTAVAAGLLGWFVSGRVLRPLRQMTATARTISAGNLSERLALSGPDDEFKQLGDTLDDLLARLEASFEAQQRFVSNASHELRTPLTVERTLLQVALADPDASAEKLRATCQELLASGRDQERLLEALLTLAVSERRVERRDQLDLATLTAQALLSPRPEIARDSLDVTTKLGAAPAIGDPALVERLIANLIDNAVRYNERGGTVEIRTATEEDRSILAIANTGTVVPAQELGRLFEPFQRLDGQRTGTADGRHGLGLSIVRAIAAAHGGTVTALPQPDGGLAVTVRFPAATGGPSGVAL